MRLVMRAFDFADQWPDRNPTDAERLGKIFIEQVMGEFKDELDKCHPAEHLEAIKDHFRVQLWLKLCSFVWRANGSVPHNLEPLPPYFPPTKEEQKAEYEKLLDSMADSDD